MIITRNLKTPLHCLLFLVLNISVPLYSDYPAPRVHHNSTSIFDQVKILHQPSLSITPDVSEAPTGQKQKLTLQVELPTHDQMVALCLESLTTPHTINFFHTSHFPCNLDQTFLKKMELYSGGEHCGTHVLAAIDNTTTIFGHAMLAGLLGEPIHSIPILQERQDAIKELIGNTQCTQAIQDALDTIKMTEAHLFSYFKQENSSSRELLKKVYWSDKFDRLNNSTLGLELGTRLGNLETSINLLFYPFTQLLVRTLQHINIDEFSKKDVTALSKKELILETITAGGKGFTTALATLPQEIDPRLDRFNAEFSLARYHDYTNPQYDSVNNPITIAFKDLPLADQQGIITNTMPKTLGDQVYKIKNMTPGFPRNGFITFNYIIPGLLASFYAYGAYNALKEAKLRQDIANCLHKNLIGVASYIKAINSLHSTVRNNPILSKIVDLNLFDLEANTQLSADCRILLDLLGHTTFTGNPSLFSLTGRVLAAHRLMQKVKQELIPACAQAGLIDAYLSTAKLYTKHRDTPVHFCFPTFAQGSTKPFINAVGFWNTLIDAYTVIVNDIALGDSHPNNVILTGPNTGGKSTVIKGLLVNLLLAQTISIAPATQLIFTPFVNLNCYLNITDDLAAGTSLFKAEVLRAKALINAIRNLAHNEFSFTIIDEIFSGTSPQEGEEAAVMFAQELGNSANSICTIATHFPRLTNELSSNVFKNYKVSVYKDEHNQWVRPYKLEEGKSLLNIAMDLLREEGVLTVGGTLTT